MGIKTDTEQGFTLRVPLPVFERLREYQREHPHFSLNALIVEALSQFLDRRKEAEE
jgi:hypothetical protein